MGVMTSLLQDWCAPRRLKKELVASWEVLSRPCFSLKAVYASSRGGLCSPAIGRTSRSITTARSRRASSRSKSNWSPCQNFLEVPPDGARRPG